MSTLIATGSALFLSTTGFTYASLVTWAGNNVLLMLGGGLGLVDAMMGWIDRQHDDSGYPHSEAWEAAKEGKPHA